MRTIPLYVQRSLDEGDRQVEFFRDASNKWYKNPASRIVKLTEREYMLIRAFIEKISNETPPSEAGHGTKPGRKNKGSRKEGT